MIKAYFLADYVWFERMMLIVVASLICAQYHWMLVGVKSVIFWTGKDKIMRFVSFLGKKDAVSILFGICVRGVFFQQSSMSWEHI